MGLKTFVWKGDSENHAYSAVSMSIKELNVAIQQRIGKLKNKILWTNVCLKWTSHMLSLMFSGNFLFKTVIQSAKFRRERSVATSIWLFIFEYLSKLSLGKKKYKEVRSHDCRWQCVPCCQMVLISEENVKYLPPPKWDSIYLSVLDCRLSRFDFAGQ